MLDLPDGIIELDSERAVPFGFTSDKFSEASYLWKAGKTIVISAIESLARGNFRSLVETIRSHGLAIEVPTPSARMREIVTKSGYRQSFQYSEDFGETIELWRLDA